MTTVVRSATAPEHGRPPLPGVKNVIAVGAGKGGVGKTTVAVNLALALAKMGARAGILDGDIYGPNVPMMLGLKAELESDGQQIGPAEKYGLQVVSIGFMTDDDAPVIWRGPMLHSAIQQFSATSAWRDLDYLIVDMPPGTGDVALSVSARRCRWPAPWSSRRRSRCRSPTPGARCAMYQKAEHPADGRGREHELLLVPELPPRDATSSATAAASELAAEMGIPFLGRLPVYQPIRVGSDRGIPLVIAEPDAPATRAFRSWPRTRRRRSRWPRTGAPPPTRARFR